jgi:hypothetical protein
LAEALRIPIKLHAHPRAAGPQPIRIGIPLPRSRVDATERISLSDKAGRNLSCDVRPLSRWPDGSLKWILLDFLAKGNPEDDEYFLSDGGTGGEPVTSARLTCREEGGRYVVDTGTARFTVSPESLHPWRQAEIGGHTLLAPPSSDSPGALFHLSNAPGKALRFERVQSKIGFEGKTRLDVIVEGRFVGGRGEEILQAACRISFFAGTALSRARYTLWNRRAARHPGGLWDLGDPASVLFRSLSVPLAFAADAAPEARISLDPAAEEAIACSERLSLLQASSGGPNWKSRNHADRNNRVTLKHAGYILRNGGGSKEGARTNPALLIRHRAGTAAFTREHFWQAFPSRISLDGAEMALAPFPAQDGQDYELQGGEKASFTLWADFLADPAKPHAALSSARLPIAAMADPAWIATSGCVSGATPRMEKEDAFFAGMEDAWLSGPHSLSALREEYDEYGWRNFGEVAADHEKQHYKGGWEFVSHYNNQYDLVLSFLRESLRTGNPGWASLGNDLARHVADHDLYHTREDKPAYNGGYFWHTAHYAHAGTATHRTFSRLCAEGGALPGGFGGGPSNEHNYTSGLLLHYWLTGDPDSYEAVLMLARWVRDMQDGAGTPLRFLSRNPTGLSTCTRHLDFQGPGRGAGYSVNACLDAYALTGQEEWMRLAEEFIRTCIHPEDDCTEMGLLDRENRWSYVIFLQALAKYLDVKLGLDRRDAAFDYARASLLHYADWMAEKESPNLSNPAELEYPTSTWAAQDLRKTDALLSAARYAEPGKADRYIERAGFFYAKAKEDLAAFADKGSVRNMAIILYSLPAWREHEAGRLRRLDLGPVRGPFAARIRLVPQKIQFLRNAKAIVKTCGLAGAGMFFRYARNRFR